MNISRAFPSSRFWPISLVIIAIVLVPIAAVVMLQGGTDRAILIGQAVLFGVLVFAILQKPYLGIVATITSLPVLDILPPIPYASSIVSLLGGVTLASYFLQNLKFPRTAHTPFPKGLIWGLLFIFWFVVANPGAALLSENDSRAWLFTFAQLWILAWLAWKLMDTPHKHYVLIWTYSAATVVSAIYGIQEGVIGESIKESIRTGGLVGGANSAARYFVVALVFMYYLRNTVGSRLLRFLLFMGMGIIILGTLYTISRTGLLLLIGAVGMLFILNLGGTRRVQAGVVFTLVLIMTWFFADNIFFILGSVVPAIREGTDTVGLRYGLWRAGWRMWLDHPIQGVGIGQFPVNLPRYGRDLLPAHRLSLGAHNMYVQVLAETGAVGLFLFAGILGSAFRSLWQAGRSLDVTLTPLARTWLIIFVLMLLGGITKHDHYDKLVWLVTGVSMVQLWKR